MKIVDARVIVCSPGRNFVTLKITTEDGIYGLGDATLKYPYERAYLPVNRKFDGTVHRW
jgi:L-alanine-DL-glutamate epimerase-like enolase superfamily enzyme